jgi:ppGpp synthetase/RelA/SpoT-type nucleotidyltranferase
MNSTIPVGIQRDPAKWRTLSDKEWVKLHVPRFEKIRPRYEIYEKFLKTVLHAACGTLAPLAIIEARTKSLSSFAEKIIRKRKLYMDPKDPLPPDPLIRMTDLSGGRVITQTSEQVHAICRFIEETFDIDRDNSEDVSNRLKPTEFGYRSVHYIVSVNQEKLRYIVSVNKEKLRAAGVTIADQRKVLGLKAEIQVRTLLEHTWADMGHDMTYKTELKVPDRIHRQFAAVAAVLESMDREFGRLVHALAEFKSNFGAYHTREEVDKEINSLRVLLSTNAATADLAVRIAQLALATGKHRLALDILEPYAHEHHQGVERVRGIALTEMFWSRPGNRKYIEGRRSLQTACAHPRKDAETLCALAESWVRDDESKARQLFHEAIVLDPSEPVTLSRYLELEVARISNDRVLQLTAPMISNAVTRCRKQIEARVNLPWAWSSLALFHLFGGEPFEALDAIAQVIRLCDPPQESAAARKRGGGESGPPCTAGRALMRMRDTFARIRCIKEELAGYDWCERAILLGLATRVEDSDAARALRKLASPPKVRPRISPNATVVILSGGCTPEFRSHMKTLKPHLVRATEDLAFTLLWGGTEDGISGLAGSIAERSRGLIRAFGYLPRLPGRRVRGNTGSMRFGRCIHTSGSDFTPLEPLQGWIDLVATGVDARRVKLMSYAGGQISNSECAMALALGARVGVVEDTTLPKERQFSDPGWQDHRNLIRLPMDAMTLRAFLLVDELPCKRDEFEMAAQRTHEEYVKSAIPREPSLLPWKSLVEDLKVSNYHQVAYAENILKTAGLGIRPITDPKKPLLRMEKVIGEKGIRRLAEMEHGRWNVERLLLGWHHAEIKDVARKDSPYLVPWRNVPPEIQEFDLEAIRSLPAKFREAGLEVYKL